MPTDNVLDVCEWCVEVLSFSPQMGVYPPSRMKVVQALHPCGHVVTVNPLRTTIGVVAKPIRHLEDG